MGQLSETKLKAKLLAAKEKIAIDGRYCHYKDPSHTYTVSDIAILESTEDPVVIYKAEYGNNITFVRPADEWLEVVEKDSKQVLRFKKI